MQPRDAEKLKLEVVQMREKMRAVQKISTDVFDLKHSAGGIIDVEFMVQYMVLSYSAKYSQLANNDGNIAILKMLAELNIIDKNLSKQVANAYREYRKMIHQTKLQEKAATVDWLQVSQHQAAVLSLWNAIFV
jgi:glutamate-ammonia-ligase adenylyltransferase